jgi:hypothetical protein
LEKIFTSLGEIVAQILRVIVWPLGLFAAHLVIFKIITGAPTSEQILSLSRMIREGLSVQELKSLLDALGISAVVPIGSLFLLVILMNVWMFIVNLIGNITPPMLVWRREELIRNIPLSPNIREKFIKYFPDIHNVYDIAARIEESFNNLPDGNSNKQTWEIDLARSSQAFVIIKATLVLAICLTIISLSLGHSPNWKIVSLIITALIAGTVYCILRSMYAIEQSTHEAIFAAYRSFPDIDRPVDTIVMEDTALPIVSRWWSFNLYRSFLFPAVGSWQNRRIRANAMT